MSGKIELPFKLYKRGKVRDVYEVEGKLLIISSDRISAFDYVLPSLIPDKGKVLNKISSFWFEYTEDFIKNHVVSHEPENLDILKDFRDKIKQRAILASKVQVFPIEAIVRDYIVGSGWNSYKESGEICGIKIKDGLTFGDRLPEPVFTPSTKADKGHDINISFEEVENLIGRADAQKMKELSVALFKKVSDYALKKGIVLADTKFEFGKDEEGNIILADEIFTPDSSRFWKLSEYQEAKAKDKTPPSYDKQYVRNFLLNSNWDRNSTPPQLPGEVIKETTNKYKEIYHILTGKRI